MLKIGQYRRTESFPKKDAFVVSYFVGDPFVAGIVQAFRIKEGQLFVLSFEERGRERVKTRWIPALCCSCRKILSLDTLQELIERDNVSLRDLKIIENFHQLYNELVRKSSMRK